jgi:hypothetical protein
MKMAQGSSPGSSTGEATHLRILYENSELDGRTIANLSSPSLKTIQLSEIKIKNIGPHEARDVSAGLYLSRQVIEQGVHRKRRIEFRLSISFRRNRARDSSSRDMEFASI